MSIAQLLPQQVYLALPLNNLEDQVELLESGSQGYKGGNVTEVDHPLSFLLSFCFDQFITYAFPDIAMDIDSFI